MALRRPRIFGKKDSPSEKPENNQASLTWERVRESQKASAQLIHFMYGLINESLIAINPVSSSTDPAPNVIGHPASNKLTYRNDIFSLTRSRQWLTTAENKQENMHYNGLKFRRYIEPRSILSSNSWWEVDIRESGVMRLTASHYPDGERKLVDIYESLVGKLKNGSTADDFGVRLMGFNKGEVAVDFGLHVRDRTELYIPVSMTFLNDEIIDHIHEQTCLALAELSGGHFFDINNLDDKIN